MNLTSIHAEDYVAAVIFSNGNCKRFGVVSFKSARIFVVFHAVHINITEKQVLFLFSREAPASANNK